MLSGWDSAASTSACSEPGWRMAAPAISLTWVSERRPLRKASSVAGRRSEPAGRLERGDGRAHSGPGGFGKVGGCRTVALATPHVGRLHPPSGEELPARGKLLDFGEDLEHSGGIGPTQPFGLEVGQVRAELAGHPPQCLERHGPNGASGVLHGTEGAVDVDPPVVTVGGARRLPSALRNGRRVCPAPVVSLGKESLDVSCAHVVAGRPVCLCPRPGRVLQFIVEIATTTTTAAARAAPVPVTVQPTNRRPAASGPSPR